MESIKNLFFFFPQLDDKENNDEDTSPTNSNYDAATLVIGEKKNGFSDKKVGIFGIQIQITDSHEYCQFYDLI